MRGGCHDNYRMYLDCEGAAYQTTGRGIFVSRWGFCTHMVVGRDPITRHMGPVPLRTVRRVVGVGTQIYEKPYTRPIGPNFRKNFIWLSIWDSWAQGAGLSGAGLGAKDPGDSPPYALARQLRPPISPLSPEAYAALCVPLSLIIRLDLSRVLCTGYAERSALGARM